MPDPPLRRYFEHLFGVQDPAAVEAASTLAWLRLTAEEEPEHLYPVADYWRHHTLSMLGTQLSYHQEDPTRGVMLSLAVVQTALLESLRASVEAGLLCARDGVTAAQRSYRLAYAAAHGRAFGRDLSAATDWPIRDAAWRWLFDADESTLRHRFAVAHPDLWHEDIGPPIRIWEDDWIMQHKRRPTADDWEAIRHAHGIEPWHRKPDHFLIWAWAHHRHVTYADLAPYALDQHHWEVLTGESDLAHTGSGQPEED